MGGLAAPGPLPLAPRLPERDWRQEEWRARKAASKRECAFSFPDQNKPGKNLGLPPIAVRYSGFAKSTRSSVERRWPRTATCASDTANEVIDAVCISGSESISANTAA